LEGAGCKFRACRKKDEAAACRRRRAERRGESRSDVSRLRADVYRQEAAFAARRAGRTQKRGGEPRLASERAVASERFRGRPYVGVVERTFMLADRWQIHYMSGVAGETIAPDAIDISFNIGHLKQTVEFGQYYVTNLGKGVDPASLPSGSEDPR
jgi:hypothetical protein